MDGSSDGAPSPAGYSLWFAGGSACTSSPVLSKSAQGVPVVCPKSLRFTTGKSRTNTLFTLPLPKPAPHPPSIGAAGEPSVGWTEGERREAASACASACSADLRCRGFYLFVPRFAAAASEPSSGTSDAGPGRAPSCRGLSDLGADSGVLTDLDDYSYAKIASPAEAAAVPVRGVDASAGRALGAAAATLAGSSTDEEPDEDDIGWSQQAASVPSPHRPPMHLAPLPPQARMPSPPGLRAGPVVRRDAATSTATTTPGTTTAQTTMTSTQTTTAPYTTATTTVTSTFTETATSKSETIRNQTRCILVIRKKCTELVAHVKKTSVTVT